MPCLLLLNAKKSPSGRPFYYAKHDPPKSRGALITDTFYSFSPHRTGHALRWGRPGPPGVGDAYGGGDAGAPQRAAGEVGGSLTEAAHTLSPSPLPNERHTRRRVPLGDIDMGEIYIVTHSMGAHIYVRIWVKYIYVRYVCIPVVCYICINMCT